MLWVKDAIIKQFKKCQPAAFNLYLSLYKLSQTEYMLYTNLFITAWDASDKKSVSQRNSWAMFQIQFVFPIWANQIVKSLSSVLIKVFKV